MRVGRGLALVSVGVLTATGLSVTGGSAADSTLYVAQERCVRGAEEGTHSRPFCEINDAAKVVRPGQTVAVDQGSYNESVVVPSGEPGKPVTFSGYSGPQSRTYVRPGFRLSGVHDVVIEGFGIGQALQSGPAVLVENSGDVTIRNGAISAGRVPGLQIKDGSHRVTISGMTGFGSGAPAFAIGPGATDTLLTGTSVQVWRSDPAGAFGPGVSVVDAPRTTITNNTVLGDCRDALEVSGASGGFKLYNSVLGTKLYPATVLPENPCAERPFPDPATLTALTVTGAATTDSEIDYNLLDPTYGAPYVWDGTTYPDQATFHATTGRGAHDIAADPWVVGPHGSPASSVPVGPSPAIDSALATAPGIQPVDLHGNGRADKPDTPNSGGGYVDRGAIELLPTPTFTSTIERAAGGGSLETVTTATLTFPWTMNGPAGTFSFATDGKQAIVNRTGSARLTHDRAGVGCVDVRFDLGGFRGYLPSGEQSRCLVLGASYTSVTPQRVLDTRPALGPVGQNAEIEFALPAAAAGASAVVLNVTATEPSTSGYLKVYPAGGEAEPTASNLNYAAGQTIANLVTVKVVNGKVRVRNGGRGTTHVIADLAGYYGNSGDGLTAGTPARVLDTRSTSAIGPQGRVTVDLSSRLPAGATAAVLNLTVTGATNGGLFTAYPPGADVPTASNVNFVAGQTVNNMVIAPVVDGKVAFAHTGKGTVHLIADLAGAFAPGDRDTYLPTAPSRLVDTRTATPVGPGQTVRVFVDRSECGTTGCGPRTAVVANLTVTEAARSGYLTVYPYGQDRPTQSVLNFNAGQTAASLVTVGLGEDSFLVYNGGKGTAHVLVDQAGFYLAPANQ
ncbi:right-handed parallel beta-helix repeat-containing protein [Asanoa siamensis]|nr:right-handed parallel beta-helix repeat-containing protein [Asanoa siamensis]